MADDFRLNMREIVNLTNEVLEADCVPLANKAAQIARDNAPDATGEYRESIHVEVVPRTGIDDWADAYVVADAPHAGVVEARTGNLTRALNAAG